MCMIGPVMAGARTLHQTTAPLFGEYEGGAVVAFRCFKVGWRWNLGGHRLESVHAGFVYETNPEESSPPSRGWLRGFWAWRREEAARAYFRDTAGAEAILARVELYGEVIEHERGYRGQYQRIVAFLGRGVEVPANILAELASFYDVREVTP